MGKQRDDYQKAVDQIKGIIKKFTKDKGWQGENACKDGLRLVDELYEGIELNYNMGYKQGKKDSRED